MSLKKRLRITVYEKLNGEDIFWKKLSITPKYPLVCDKFEECKEFIVEDNDIMPKGFCTWAWDDLVRMITYLQYNGDFPFYEEKGAALASCTDGVRPVIFKLENLMINKNRERPNRA